MNGYVHATLSQQTAGALVPRMQSIDKRIAPRPQMQKDEKMTEKDRNEFLAAARRYLFGLTAAINRM